MPTTWRWQIGECLARLPGVLRYDGEAPNGARRYINRINGHCVLRGGEA